MEVLHRQQSLFPPHRHFSLQNSATVVLRVHQLFTETVLSWLGLYSDAYVATACAILASISFVWLSSLFLSQGVVQRRPHGSSAIQMLSKILIPTRSTWPSHYLEATTKAEASQSRRIILALSVVLDDVRNGKLEFRNPKEHLQHLVQGDISLDGWSLRLDPGRLGWIKSLYWLIMNEIPLMSYEPHFDAQSTGDYMRLIHIILYFIKHNLTDLPATLISLPKGTPESHNSRRSHRPLAHKPHLPSQNISSTHQPCAVPLFDTVPRPHLKEFVLAIQRRIHSNYLENFEVEFTTCEEPRSIFDETMTLFTPPFLPKTQSTYRDERIPLTSTSLLTPLHLILSLFTSGPHMLHIDNIKNVSVERSAYLEQYAECLEEDPELRSAFVVRAGIKEWREEMLHAYWEAALFRAKVLTRWVVVFKNMNARLHTNSRSLSKSDGSTQS